MRFSDTAVVRTQRGAQVPTSPTRAAPMQEELQGTVQCSSTLDHAVTVTAEQYKPLAVKENESVRL